MRLEMIATRIHSAVRYFMVSRLGLNASVGDCRNVNASADDRGQFPLTVRDCKVEITVPDRSTEKLLLTVTPRQSVERI
jgi:hypothetical protein